MAAGFVDYLRGVMGWWSSSSSAPEFDLGAIQYATTKGPIEFATDEGPIEYATSRNPIEWSTD